MDRFPDEADTRTEGDRELARDSDRARRDRGLMRDHPERKINGKTHARRGGDMYIDEQIDG